jgi:hypothetical protein
MSGVGIDEKGVTQFWLEHQKRRDQLAHWRAGMWWCEAAKWICVAQNGDIWRTDDSSTKAGSVLDRLSVGLLVWKEIWGGGGCTLP